MDHFVRLNHWPENLKIPEEYSKQLIFDVEHHRLGYRGYMRKADFDSLASLSKDPNYLDALQDLFTHATYEGASSKRRPWTWLVAGGITAAGALAATTLFFQRRHRDN